MFNYYVYYICHCNTIIIVIVMLLNSILTNRLAVFISAVAFILMNLNGYVCKRSTNLLIMKDQCVYDLYISVYAFYIYICSYML